MKKYTVWIDTDWGPGGIDWDLERNGSARVYAKHGMKTWVRATLTIDRSPHVKKPTRAKQKALKSKSTLLV